MHQQPMNQPWTGAGPVDLQSVPIDPQLEAELRREEEKHQAREKRIEEDAHATVVWMLIIGCANVVLLAIPMLTGTWSYKSFVGIGIKFMIIKTSLFSVDIEVVCGKNYVEDIMCEAGRRMNGVHSLYQGQALACGISRQACDVMRDIYGASYIIFCNFALCITGLSLSLGFLYYYWYVEPSSRLRSWAIALYAIVPVAGITGMAAWSLFMPNLAELPNGWTAAGTSATGMSLFGYHAVDTFPYGWGWVWSAIVFAEMLIGLSIWPHFFRKSPKEEAWEEKQAALMEDNVNSARDNFPATPAAVPFPAAEVHVMPAGAPVFSGPVTMGPMGPMGPMAAGGHQQRLGPAMGQPAMGQQADFGMPRPMQQGWG